MTRVVVMADDEVRALIKEEVAAAIQHVLEDMNASSSLLTKKQVAAMLNVSTQVVDGLRRRGELSERRIGDALRFRIEDVEALVKK